MKLKISTQNIFLALLIMLCPQSLSAQDTVMIHLTSYYGGQITWENSPDNFTWNVIPGETDDSLQAIINQTTWFRAIINDGTCVPNYTETIEVIYPLPGSPCPGMPTITDGDGNLYNTVLIGSQCWMKENLRVGSMIGTLLDQTDNTIIEKYCYDNDTANCEVYGGLYQWAEVVQYLNGATNSSSWNPVPTGHVQGICPTGWHVPTETEWCTLITYYDPSVDCSIINWSSSIAGGELKETGTSHWASPNTGATNSSGFTGLATGFHAFTGVYYEQYLTTNIWSASEKPSTTYPESVGYNLKLSYNNTVSLMNSSWKIYGLSVRCLKD